MFVVIWKLCHIHSLSSREIFQMGVTTLPAASYLNNGGNKNNLRTKHPHCKEANVMSGILR